MFDITNIYFRDEEDNIIEPDEDGSINLSPYIHDKIYVCCSIVPVNALRCITVELPWYVDTSYSRIGKGIKHHRMFCINNRFNKKRAQTPSFKCRLLNDDGAEVYRDCIGHKYRFHRRLLV